MLGTAPQVGFWLMLEVRDRWEAKNLKNNQLPDSVKHWLADIEERAEELNWLPRFQFIRKRNASNTPLTLITCRNDVVRSQEFDDFNQLTQSDPLTDDLPRINETIYFVCAHGSRDVCCSRLGLETWREIEKLASGRVWQTTHLGGHRFAPNVLVLPSARMYGRVYADQVDGFVKAIESDDFAWEFARGNSQLPKPVQVCEEAILSDQGKLVEITQDAIHYENSLGMQTMPMPTERTLKVQTSCIDEEVSDVSYYTLDSQTG